MAATPDKKTEDKIPKPKVPAKLGRTKPPEPPVMMPETGMSEPMTSFSTLTIERSEPERPKAAASVQQVKCEKPVPSTSSAATPVVIPTVSSTPQVTPSVSTTPEASIIVDDLTPVIIHPAYRSFLLNNLQMLTEEQFHHLMIAGTARKMLADPNIVIELSRYARIRHPNPRIRQWFTAYTMYQYAETRTIPILVVLMMQGCCTCGRATLRFCYTCPKPACEDCMNDSGRCMSCVSRPKCTIRIYVRRSTV